MKKALQKALDNENMKTVKDVLKQLYQVKATTSLLQQTQIGKVVNHVKKNPNVTDDIIKLSKKIINNWKQDIEGETKASSYDSTSSPKSTKSETKSKPEPPKRTSATDGVRLVSTGNKARDGCANMLYKALALYEGSSPQVISKKASQIENEVYKLYQSVDSKYKSKIRSLYLNLKDKTNPHLRERVLNDDISASEFCQMSPTEMASEEKQEEFKKIKDKNLFLARGAESQQAETDQFKCGKCKSRKCKYYQMQTRSADEEQLIIT
ncbi:hypothetical protein PIROE2DRAFT_60473 [Piromyces sp. E2]|nr:hypothetical protein PIROE2DRAFT_60473 [Piromyces sp. E2]|eukprot:OUM64743.1 hypothetical protein PIROE2DRAFT_60473 [Piromyces sp. E2]